MSNEVVARAPGKVNLALHVGTPGDDGYHPLATVFQAVSLHDDVVVRDGGGEGVRLTVTGEGADEVPTDATNLAWRAVLALSAHVGRDPDVEVELRKGIPVAGGMAGGSADAAATLVACDALWGTGLSRDELDALARGLGSDVPFALHGGTALGTGRGDRLTPVLARGEYHWVFALADGGLATPRVYGELDRLRGDAVLPEPRVADDVMAALRSGDPVGLGHALANDLQDAAVALRPELRLVLDGGMEAGALGGIVSGSGPTCAFLARDTTHAVDIAVSLAGVGACRTVRTATSPAPGARLV